MNSWRRKIHPNKTLLVLATLILLTGGLLFFRKGPAGKKGVLAKQVSQDSIGNSLSLPKKDASIETKPAQTSLREKVQPRPIKEAPTKKPAFTILVESEARKPIDGATVSLFLDQSLQEVKQTDTMGKATFNAKLKGNLRYVLVRKEGFGLEFRWIKEERSTYRVALSREGFIEGNVETPLGGPLSKIRVFAFPKGFPDFRFLNSPQAREVLKRKGIFSKTQSDSQGHFRLTGLNPKIPYNLFWGGRGWAGVDPLIGIRCNSSPQKLVCWKIYGRVGKVVMRDHSVPLKVQNCRISCGDPITSPKLDYEPMNIFSSSLTLAGIPSVQSYKSWKTGMWDWRLNEEFLGLKSDTLTEITLPLVYMVPGLKKEKFLLHLLPCKEGPVATQPLYFTKTAMGFGKVVLKMKNGLDPKRFGIHLPLRLNTFGKLKFIPVNKGDSFTVFLNRLWGPPKTVPGIPFGDYKVKLNLLTGPSIPPLEGTLVSIGPKPVTLTWDFKRSAGILFKKKQMALDSLEINLVYLDGNNWRIQFHLRGPSFFLPCLWEGNFNFKIDSSRFGKPLHLFLKNIHTKRGEVLEVPCYFK